MGENYSYLETGIRIFSEKLKQYKVPIVSAVITAFIAYTFMFTNKIINWDDTQFLFGKGYTTTSGRWGLDILSWILPN